MPATTGIQLGFWQAVFWAALLIVAVAATVVSLRRKQGNEPDAAFWNAFAGLTVIMPALLVPALASPAVGLLLLGLAAATAAATLYGERLHSRQSLLVAAAARHQAVLRRWRRYELDPARQIDYPDMSDPRVPSTAAFFRAMRRAENSRILFDGGYPAAVEQLSRALAEAESAAGAGQKRWPAGGTAAHRAAAPITLNANHSHLI